MTSAREASPALVEERADAQALSMRTGRHQHRPFEHQHRSAVGAAAILDVERLLPCEVRVRTVGRTASTSTAGRPLIRRRLVSKSLLVANTALVMMSMILRCRSGSLGAAPPLDLIGAVGHRDRHAVVEQDVGDEGAAPAMISDRERPPELRIDGGTCVHQCASVVGRVGGDRA